MHGSSFTRDKHSFYVFAWYLNFIRKFFVSVQYAISVLVQ